MPLPPSMAASVRNLCPPYKQNRLSERPRRGFPGISVGLRRIALASIRQLAYRLFMRLKSSIWVAAYLRRCQTEGVFGAVRRRGAEEAGAGFCTGAMRGRNTAAVG